MKRLVHLIFLTATVASAQACNFSGQSKEMLFEVIVNSDIPTDCGIENTLKALQRDPNHLQELQQNPNPNVRIAYPTTKMSAEFQPNRQNIIVDENKQTITIRCG